MNYKLRTDSGFTLIELVVAIALLAMVLGFSSVIFKVSIGAHRTAGANAEIMQKLRAITDQLNTDFKGLQKDAPLLMWFQEDTGVPEPNRYDQIMFFANGDSQSTRLYAGSPAVPAYTGNPVVGNIARIYYGQAQSRDSRNDMMRDPLYLLEEDRTLARRQHILTADSGIYAWFNPTDFTNFNDFVFGYRNNDFYEHDRISLAQWRTVDRTIYSSQIIPACFAFRPSIDMDDPNTFHNLVSGGLGSLSIQWAYWDSDIGVEQYHWFPSDNPDGDISTIDSHFDLIADRFGVYFNVPGSTAITDWLAVEDGNIEYKPPPASDTFPPDFFPKALKFTFTLYDSKGILEGGRTFTHIVYLDN